MIAEYVQEALFRAKYEQIDDDEPFYAEIVELPGLWAQGRSYEECRSRLIDVIEGWILLSVEKGLPIPRLGSRSIEYAESNVEE